MSKPFLTVLILLISFTSFSQDSKPTKKLVSELGVNLKVQPLSDVKLRYTGLNYKLGGSKFLWRTSLNGSYRGMLPQEEIPSLKTKQYSILGSTGMEYRLKLAKKFNMLFGFDGTFRFINVKSISESSVQSMTETTSSTFSPGVNLVLGVNYALFDKVVFTAELLPNFDYSRRMVNIATFENDQLIDEADDIVETMSFGTAVNFSIAYRF